MGFHAEVRVNAVVVNIVGLNAIVEAIAGGIMKYLIVVILFYY